MLIKSIVKQSKTTLFNELYDGDYYESKRDTLVTKDQVKLAHTRLFEIGSKVTLLHFQHKGPDKIDIKYRVVNAEADHTIHQLIITENKKIIRAEDMDQRIEECPPARREVRREERMMRDDPSMVMCDPYADPYRRGGLVRDIRRDERMVRRCERRW